MIKKLSSIIIIGVVILLGFYFLKAGSNAKLDQKESKSQSSVLSISESDKPQIIATKPDPLNETIIPADQIIEITFNRSLQNAPEFKVRIEPKIEYKVELTQDRKTARIIPSKPYELGGSYTLYIGPDTKFDGVGEWGQDKTFYFRTIKYRGI